MLVEFAREGDEGDDDIDVAALLSVEAKLAVEVDLATAS